MARYDLTAKISPHLDRHLVFPLLEFLQTKNIYSEEELMTAKLELLSKTNMVDFAMDMYKKLHKSDNVPEEMLKKRQIVVSKLKTLVESDPLLQLCQNPELVEQLKTEKKWSLRELEASHGVLPESLDALYQYAKFQFDCGNYSGAAEILFHYKTFSVNQDKIFSSLWGKFGAEILMQNWESAYEDMFKLKEIIDAKTTASPLVQLQQRTWLIHWSLFVFFNHPNGKNGIIELFFQDRYLNTIQTSCPHILRYLTAAVITNKRKRSSLKDLVKVIQQESYTYRDPITEFLEALYVNFDFDGAQTKLRECENVLVNDFFLVSCRDDFIENARRLIFETYCRIHQCIDIWMLAEKLNMEEEAAERWIVDLIRNARLDAKIDSARNQVIMGTQYSSVYQQVIEKTKGLSYRSSVLSNSLAKGFDDLPQPGPSGNPTTDQ